MLSHNIVVMIHGNNPMCNRITVPAIGRQWLCFVVEVRTGWICTSETGAGEEMRKPQEYNRLI
jgi:hypothetical protein